MLSCVTEGSKEIPVQIPLLKAEKFFTFFMCHVLQSSLHTGGFYSPWFNVSMSFLYCIVWIVALFSNTVSQASNKGECWIPSTLLCTPECVTSSLPQGHRNVPFVYRDSSGPFLHLHSSQSVPGLNCSSAELRLYAAELYEIPVNSFCQPVKTFLNAFLEIWCRLLSGIRCCTSHLWISPSH